MRVEELDTPAVVVDMDVMEENIRSLAAYCKQHNLNLRPHTKTHKIPAIAKLQVQAGFPGITVAKVGEAEVMAEAGLEDILVAYPVFGRSKACRLGQLARERKITVAMDSAEVAEGLSAAARETGSKMDVLLEFDAGMRRCGVETPSALVELGRARAKTTPTEPCRRPILPRAHLGKTRRARASTGAVGQAHSNHAGSHAG